MCHWNSLYWFHAFYGPKHKNFITLFSSRVVVFVFYEVKLCHQFSKCLRQKCLRKKISYTLNLPVVKASTTKFGALFCGILSRGVSSGASIEFRNLVLQATCILNVFTIFLTTIPFRRVKLLLIALSTSYMMYCIFFRWPKLVYASQLTQ